MARSRNLKPSFFTNDKLADIDPLGRLLFAGLWTIADREGRLEDRPKRIKAEILPYDNANTDKLLLDLQAAGFILRYSVNGSRYIQVLAFTKHQNPHVREGPSTIPAPDKHSASTVPGPAIPEPARLIPDSPIPLTDSLEREAPRKRAAQLSEGWEVPSEWIAWTLGERKAWQERDVIRVSLAFRDHWIGNGTAKADWFATWRNWVRRERDPPVERRSNGKTQAEKRADVAAGIWGDSDGTGGDKVRDITAEVRRIA
jgi:hypothetical protein